MAALILDADHMEGMTQGKSALVGLWRRLMLRLQGPWIAHHVSVLCRIRRNSDIVILAWVIANHTDDSSGFEKVRESSPNEVSNFVSHATIVLQGLLFGSRLNLL